MLPAQSQWSWTLWSHSSFKSLHLPLFFSRYTLRATRSFSTPFEGHPRTLRNDGLLCFSCLSGPACPRSPSAQASEVPVWLARAATPHATPSPLCSDFGNLLMIRMGRSRYIVVIAAGVQGARLFSFWHRPRKVSKFSEKMLYVEIGIWKDIYLYIYIFIFIYICYIYFLYTYIFIYIKYVYILFIYI